MSLCVLCVCVAAMQMPTVTPGLLRRLNLKVVSQVSIEGGGIPIQRVAQFTPVKGKQNTQSPSGKSHRYTSGTCLHIEKNHLGEGDSRQTASWTLLVQVYTVITLITVTVKMVNISLLNKSQNNQHSD